MSKYADDTYLLVGSSMRNTISEELMSVELWATANNLRLNVRKTREMIITRNRKVLPPQALEGLERVSTIKILGVTITNDLRATNHVEEVLVSCSGALHALRILRSNGLPSGALCRVAEATVVSRLTYAAPAWWGLTTAEDRKRLERLLQRIKHAGYLPPNSPDIDQLVCDADASLLKAVIRNDFHVLRSLFPPIITRHYNLRPRPHDFTLPDRDDRNFIPRVLYGVLAKQSFSLAIGLSH